MDKLLVRVPFEDVDTILLDEYHLVNAGDDIYLDTYVSGGIDGCGRVKALQLSNLTHLFRSYIREKGEVDLHRLLEEDLVGLDTYDEFDFFNVAYVVPAILQSMILAPNEMVAGFVNFNNVKVEDIFIFDDNFTISMSKQKRG